MDSSRLPESPSLEQAQKQAKELLRLRRTGDPDALARFRRASPPGSVPERSMLADAQLVIARENGFDTWAELKRHILPQRPPGLERYERLARTVADAYVRGDKDPIRELNWTHGTGF